MRIQMTFDLDDEDRMALNARFGNPGRADRETIEAEIRSVVDTHIADAVFDYTMSRECPTFERAES